MRGRGLGVALGIAVVGLLVGWSGQARWRAEPGVRAGSLDGPGALADIFDLEIGRDGQILVAQPRAASIAVFSAEGEYLRTVGRRGEGPGEFQILGRMGWTGDSLWVVDFGKLHLFDRNLTFVRTIVHAQVAPPRGVQRLIPGPVLADGAVLGIPIFPDSNRASPYVRISGDGVIEDTLFHLHQRNTIVHMDVGGERPANVSNPWISNPLWLAAPAGNSVILVDRPIALRGGRAAFGIIRVNLAGDTVLRREVEYNAVEITPGERDRAYERMAVRAAGQTQATPARAERAIREVVAAARYHSPVSDLVIGQDGTIWLRREDRGRATVEWEVRDDSGELLAGLTLPSAFRVLRARRERVWGVETDSLDVQYVRVYEIQER